MAVVLLDNLPLPSLKTYSLASFSLFIIVSIYSYDGENSTNFESIFDVLTFRSKKDPIYIWVSYAFLLIYKLCGILTIFVEDII